MGNHHPHEGHKSGHTTPSSSGSRKSSSNHAVPTQGADSTDKNGVQDQGATERPVPQLLPVEKLAKILKEKSLTDIGTKDITVATFTKYLFPRYQLLAKNLFEYFLRSSHSKTDYLSEKAFAIECEKYLSILNDDVIRDTFVKMFCDEHHEAEEQDVITREGLTNLLMCGYHVSMDHYAEGPQMCFSINKTLKAVVDSCFHLKVTLSHQYVSHWLAHNCPRLLLPLHRYIVHCLATSYRTLEEQGNTLAAGLELATPVLEHPPPFAPGKARHSHLLNMSLSWLLAGALPPVYSRPQMAHSPNNSAVGLSSKAFLSKLLCSVPSHWVVLYDSDDMGLGTNRFLHHVLSYKGPTLCLFKVEGDHLICVASPNEWKESHHYWGGEDSAVIQILPKFQLLEKGCKMLYLNTLVRGYPFGLRAGKDPRSPLIVVDGGFEKIDFCKIPYNLERVEVWGCGDPISREAQLEYKKWEVKEAERQRDVKLSAADWLDHPDRYLLELAGRPQYHQSQ